MQPGAHHGVGPEAQHHRAGVELHDQLPVRVQPRVTNIHRGADVHQRHDRPARRHVLAQRRARTAHARQGVRRARRRSVPTSSYEDAVGGGVSQLSTTLYNATFFGCYQDVTHSVHSLYISRYPMGREATLNYPCDRQPVQERLRVRHPDPRVLQLGLDHRRVLRQQGWSNLHAPRVRTSSQTIPPETEYVDDPTLPVGQTKVLETRPHRLRRRELPHHQHAGPARQARAVRRALLRRPRRRSPAAPAAPPPHRRPRHRPRPPRRRADRRGSRPDPARGRRLTHR